MCPTMTRATLARSKRLNHYPVLCSGGLLLASAVSRLLHNRNTGVRNAKEISRNTGTRNAKAHRNTAHLCICTSVEA